MPWKNTTKCFLLWITICALAIQISLREENNIVLKYMLAGVFLFFSPHLQSIFKDNGVNLKLGKVRLERKRHFHQRSEAVILPWVPLCSSSSIFTLEAFISVTDSIKSLAQDTRLPGHLPCWINGAVLRNGGDIFNQCGLRESLRVYLPRFQCSFSKEVPEILEIIIICKMFQKTLLWNTPITLNN